MMKEQFKQYLRYNGTAYMTAEALYENALYVPSIGRHALSLLADRLRRAIFGAPPEASVLTWEVGFPDFDGPADLIRWLRVQGIDVSEGAHTFYIPPQPALSRVIPSVVQFYPEGTGFKVLKDLRDPARARYIYKHPRSLALLNALIGAPRHQLVAANYMHALGIAPRVWDVCCWAGRRGQYTAFVVDHVVGCEPTLQQSLAFLEHVAGLDSRGPLRILVPRWREINDFRPPRCNGNLLYAEALGRVQYVDFQNFGMRDRSAWRRETVGRRWRQATASLARALREARLDLRGRLVLDLACAGGLNLHVALAEGAMWTQGWVDPTQLALVAARLFSHGSGRFDLLATEPTASPHPLRDLPRRLRSLVPGSVVFCPIGRTSVLDTLFTTPWHALACEGEASDSPRETAERLRALAQAHGATLEVLVATRIVGESRVRHPLAIVRRQGGGAIVDASLEQAE